MEQTFWPSKPRDSRKNSDKAIELINDTILKASPSSEYTTSNALVPLTIFDRAASDLHVPILYAFRAPLPSNEAIKEGLSKAFAHYPHLAGRFTTDDQGRICIILSNAGVRVIETYVPITLAEQLPFTPASEVGKNLLPPLEGVEELLQVQLNRYACDGLVLGLSSHHRVADGQSMRYFTVSWANLVRGLDIEPLPYHHRDAVSVPRNPPKSEFDHPSMDSKQRCAKEANATALFECILSHMWKKMTQAQGLEQDEFTQVRVAVNGRDRMNPPVPKEYFGNLVLWAYPRLRVKDLLQESHAYVAKAIHEAVAKIDHEYFQSFIDFGELWKGKEGELVVMVLEAGNAACPNLEVDS
ncbi:PREDICTED: agmatine coumaroyltransferase-1-like [Nelumbo nucifera]|uniref:Agmatine coumaroyltransferase-1-like n=1 Tax=Nelumbo nucifera TaxID=4432 RepID=A0A1U8Q1G0_NELNU|nr:PREDICTED: agmatine coumaroyltransferase-1-like [Nelumbo nucifera]